MQKNIKKIAVVNKYEGETPLQALERFRSSDPKYKDESITYAGRLDPMASGLLLLLIGDKVHEKEKYLALDKEYEFEVLFGFATDTYDVLGKIEHYDILDNVIISELQEKIKNNLKYFTGKFRQKYPPYSSKTVKGKPMFEYSRNNVEVEAPEREVNVKKLELVKIRKITNQKLLANIEKRIQKVSGDFRQAEILKIWRKNLSVQPSVLNIGLFTIKCTSGTYVRAIANSLGEKLCIPALAFSIKRTRVGKNKIS